MQINWLLFKVWKESCVIRGKNQSQLSLCPKLLWFLFVSSQFIRQALRCTPKSWAVLKWNVLFLLRQRYDDDILFWRDWAFNLKLFKMFFVFSWIRSCDVAGDVSVKLCCVAVNAGKAYEIRLTWGHKEKQQVNTNINNCKPCCFKAQHSSKCMTSQHSSSLLKPHVSKVKSCASHTHKVSKIGNILIFFPQFFSVLSAKTSWNKGSQ